MEHTVTTITCDMCKKPTEATELAVITLQDKSYRVDVCETHGSNVWAIATQGRPQAIPKATRKAGAPNGTGRFRSGSQPNSQSREIRAWAATRNIPCPAKGRVPQLVQDAYEMAQASSN